MAIPRFYVAETIADRSEIHLDEEKSRKLRRVLRARDGAEVILFDGSGVEAAGTVTGFDGSSAVIAVQGVSRPRREPALDLIVGMSLIKADRFELAVQKLTEIGAKRIVPIDAERSVIALRDERTWDRRLTRMQRIVIDAAEQSERVTLPEILNPMTLKEFLAKFETTALVERLDARPLTAVTLGSEVALAIGPEGGWSDSERSLIERSAASQVTLGSLILRSETAAIVAAGAIVQRWLEDSQGGP